MDGHLESDGLTVTRTGIGSDYEVESDVVDEGEEKWLEIGGRRSHLIEIKSARTTKVGMTITQARKALEENARFCLCIVMIEGEISEDSIRANSRFVFGIGEKLRAPLEGLRGIYATYLEIQSDHRPDAGIELDLEVGEPRIRILTSYANEAGLSFADALERFKGNV